MTGNQGLLSSISDIDTWFYILCASYVLRNRNPRKELINFHQRGTRYI